MLATSKEGEQSEPFGCKMRNNQQRKYMGFAIFVQKMGAALSYSYMTTTLVFIPYEREMYLLNRVISRDRGRNGSWNVLHIFLNPEN